MTPFPPGFLWRAATAAHQVEGQQYQQRPVVEHCSPTVFEEPSLDACDHDHRYEEDIRLASFGLNSHGIV
jgi:beta-glucosidase